MCEHCTRREFLGAGVAASGLMLAGTAWTHAWAAESPPKPREKSRICVIFTGGPGPDDRGWNADPKQKEAMTTCLAKAEQGLGNVELLIEPCKVTAQGRTLGLLNRLGQIADLP